MAESEINNRRILWIDIAKGIAILCVIPCHLHIPALLEKFLCAFQLYGFFFLSGLTFRVKDGQKFSSYLAENLRRLYIPYLFFAIFYDVCNTAACVYLGDPVPSFGTIGSRSVSLLIGGGVLNDGFMMGPGWFLLALLDIRLVFWWLVRLSRNNKIVLGVFSLSLFILAHFTGGSTRLPMMLLQSMTGFLFVYLGYMAKPLTAWLCRQSEARCALGSLASFILVFVFCQFQDTKLYLVSNTLPGNPVLTLLSGILGCLGLVLLAKCLESCGFLTKFFLFFGKNSMAVMGVHSEIIFFLYLLLSVLGIEGIWNFIISFCGTLVLCWPVCLFLNRYLPFVVGRKKS